MHESGARAHAPERCGADCCAGHRSTILHDEISSPDVMKEKVAERVNDLTSKRVRNVERSTVDRLATVGSHYGRYMTHTATVLTIHRFKQRSAGSYIGILLDDIGIARWCLRGTHELREHLNILRRVFTANDCRICVAECVVGYAIEGCNGSAQRRILLGYQEIGDTDFVEICISRKRKQAGVLIFPTKASDALLAVGLEHRHVNHESVHFLIGLSLLTGCDRDQGAIGNRFDKSITQGVERCSESPCSFFTGDRRTA